MPCQLEGGERDSGDSGGERGSTWSAEEEEEEEEEVEEAEQAEQAWTFPDMGEATDFLVPDTTGRNDYLPDSIERDVGGFREV